jgi:hypothetical protein
MAQHNFQVSGLTLPEGNDLFGVWQVLSSAAQGVSFDVSAPAPEPTWRIVLPASPGEAQSILSEQAHAIQRGEQALEQAQARLAQVSQRGAGVSFAAPTAGPEAELISSLGALESPVSFGLLGGEDKEQQIRDQWKSFLAQISNMVSHYARVETEIAGALVGHTAIGWTGDFNTIWKPDITAPSMRLHHQSVHLALASRIALLRMVVVVGTGAANLAVKLSIPGAQLLALPAAWKFVQDVLRESRNLKGLA